MKENLCNTRCKAFLYRCRQDEPVDVWGNDVVEDFRHCRHYICESLKREARTILEEMEMEGLLPVVVFTKPIEASTFYVDPSGNLYSTRRDGTIARSAIKA